MNLYILNGHEPVSVENITDWGNWYATADRKVKFDQLKLDSGTLDVSTVFLSLDHNFSGQGKPILFETMVFGANSLIEVSTYTRRYCTWEEAESGHVIIVARILAEDLQNKLIRMRS